jgi:Na+/H+-dicarboxylate symporter
VRNRKCGEFDEEVSSFVLHVGYYGKYMDGTSLYQAVAAIFYMALRQCFLLNLNTQLMMIVVTATLASIGSTAVPQRWYGEKCLLSF